MTEPELYKKVVKPYLNKIGVFYQRFESPGVPDIYVSKNNNVVWAEMKCINNPQIIIEPSWRPGQLAWIKEHELYGSRNICLVLYYCGEVFILPPKIKYYQEEMLCQKKTYLEMLQRK